MSYGSSTPSAPIESPLSVVCVGAGREGSTSLLQMIQNAFAEESSGRTAMHEWQGVEMGRLFCEHMETGDENCLSDIRHLISTCPYSCVTVNVIALPLIAEIFGDRVTLVHFKRRDRDRCIDSLVRNAELFPANHMYYSNSEQATGKRITAFHYGEVTRSAWNTWPVRDRFAWLYDKTHAVIEENKPLFARNFFIETESLGDRDTLAALADAIGVRVPLRPIHLNRHFSLDGLATEDGVRVQRLLGKLDVARVAQDELYGLEHFLAEFLLEVSGRVGGAKGESERATLKIGQVLARSHALLESRLADLSALLEHFGRDRVAATAEGRAEGPRDGSSMRPAPAAWNGNLLAERAAMIAERDLAIARRDEAIAQRKRLEAERTRMLDERDAAWAERDEATAQQMRLEAELTARIAERDAAWAERDEAQSQQARLQAEVTARIGERDTVRAERDEAQAQQRRLESARAAVMHEPDAAHIVRDQ